MSRALGDLPRWTTKLFPRMAGTIRCWRLDRQTVRSDMPREPGSAMNIEVLDSADSVAQKAAAIIASEARAAAASRGRFLMAVGGGHPPWVMLRALVNEGS